MRRPMLTPHTKKVHPYLGKYCDQMGCRPVRREWRVTFDGRYAHQVHPRIGNIATPDGWVTIVARDEDTARMLANALLGDAWDEVRSVDDPPFHPEGPDGWEECCPEGELLRVEVPFTPVKDES